MGPDLRELLDDLVERALHLRSPTGEQAISLLESGDEQVLEVVAAGSRVRRHFFANRVKLNLIVNMKSGLCPEDCSYCSQRRGPNAEVLQVPLDRPDRSCRDCRPGVAGGAKRVCLVASGSDPTDRDISRVAETVRVIKECHPNVEICTSLGLLTPERAERLLAAGYAYNHNLNTSEANYGEICTTHTFADRVDTVGVAHQAGLSPCSGGIFGMARPTKRSSTLPSICVSSIPTRCRSTSSSPFQAPHLQTNGSSPRNDASVSWRLFRFFFPNVEVRIAGGREIHLRSLHKTNGEILRIVLLGALAHLRSH